MTVAALYVEKGGVYWDLPDVDPWDIDRDARAYTGPHPVVAHPPCARWSMLAGLVEHQYGYKKGDDGGCFAAAVNSVREFGGVLEHPAHSAAFAHYDLPLPNAGGGWQRGFCGGWSAHVEQVHYGHRAHKATWLYAVGVDLPMLKWGKGESDVWVSYGDYDRYGHVERMGKKERRATPIPFRDLLLDMARSVTVETAT